MRYHEHMTDLCFACKTRPAGNDLGGPNSAYCADCQPIRPGRLLRPTEYECAPCSRIFATRTDFEAHQETYPRGHLLEGVFTGRCFDPVSLGLELAGDVWGTSAGNAYRGEFAARMASARPYRDSEAFSG
jgi:hypothetical protein